ncbi:RHS repeat domain-containing protein [Snodgrassella alvi]|uniref:RHS repeat domain-containing protein n=2 Tax=Snodgrassella alvi TaxID=1196083 RepID=UPI00351C7C1E
MITDHLGTPQLAINSAGEQSWKITSDAFGNSELDANNQITMNLRFPGQYYDEETGLSYNYFRNYDAKTGRYIQNDPIGLAGGVNTYGYVGGNPLVYSDPTGEIAPVAVPLIVAGIRVAINGIRFCVLNPSCNRLASEALKWGMVGWLTGLPTIPMLNDNKSKDKKDCETKDVEINDANSQNIVGGSPNPPDPDDKHNNNKNSDKELPKTREELRKILEQQGYTSSGLSKGGYETWKGPNGSKVDIKPSGEVIRTQRVWQKDGLKKYSERQDWWGNRLENQSHSTGHFVK